MADEWYYWNGSDVLGPFSGRILAGLAAAGKVLPTDIVWREGVDHDIAATGARAHARTSLLTISYHSVSPSPERADSQKPLHW